jgi:fumarylacetoacetase
MALNETHDAKLRSWVEEANRPGAQFPIQNLPFGVFRREGGGEAFRGGVAIGGQVLDLAAASRVGIFEGDAAAAALAASQPRLNALMALGAKYWSALRSALSAALREGSPQEGRLRPCMMPQPQCEHDLPATIGDFTDFYASVHHARRVGGIFRPENPLMPNYRWVPVAYHGRASSIRVGGGAVRRPLGQTKPPDAATPSFGPSRRLDYELELGAFIGPGNELGTPIPIAEAPSHVFGLCLLNDWSARDIQAWEYQPLGPLLGKNFASTLSPWIVTLEALEPFRVSWTRDKADPQPLPYLDSDENREHGALAIELEVSLLSAKMRSQGMSPMRLSRSNSRDGYWTIFQMVAHHAANGCNLMPGDLLGTGTQSGAERREAGCLLELTDNGKAPLELPSGETRVFLEDGDCVIMKGRAEREGCRAIGFGECSATILPAREWK